jgi:hypothetical protein
MLLKSSDFIVHDLSAESVFEGCANHDQSTTTTTTTTTSGGRSTCSGGKGEGVVYKLELVLRKWFAIDPSREMRAFVRDGVLVGASRLRPRLFVRPRSLTKWKLLIFLGISQRDANYYEFLNEPATQGKIVESFVTCWTTHVKPKWTGPTSCASSAFLPPSRVCATPDGLTDRPTALLFSGYCMHRYARRAPHS